MGNGEDQSSPPKLRTNYVFVDCENVHDIDLGQIANKPVRVTLVLGKGQQKLPTTLVKQVHKFAAQVELVESESSGRNALDMVLALHLGAAKQADASGYFHIISRDKDFEPLIAHLRANGTHAARHASLSEIAMLMNAAQRVDFLTRHFRASLSGRPKRRSALEAHINALFGRTLSPEDIEKSIRSLVEAKVLTISSSGLVSFAA